MITNRPDNDKRRNVVRDANEKVNSGENPQKKKNINEDTRNGMRGLFKVVPRLHYFDRWKQT
jgi:hypothetical protein